MFTNKLKIILLLITICLVSCNTEPCIDADDFGQFNSFKVFSNYLDAENVYNEHYSYQNPPWQDNNLLLNGRELVINIQTSVNSKKFDNLICDWYEHANRSSLPNEYYKLLNTSKTNYKSSEINEHCKLLNICKEDDNNNYPCLYEGGTFLEIAELDKKKINILNFTKDQDRATYSAANSLGDRVQKDNLTIIVKSSELQKGAKLLFRIKNSFNTDNSGEYSLKIRSGVQNMTDSISSSTLESIIKSIKNTLITEESLSNGRKDLVLTNFNQEDAQVEQGLVNKIYITLLLNSKFNNIVKLILTLYVIFLGFAFLIGQSNFTAQELFFHFFKIILVSFLLDSSSWDFFYNYFFKFFIYGVDQIINLVKKMSNSDLAVDQSILSLLFSDVVSKKLSSLFFVYFFPLGIIYIVLTYILFILSFFIIIEVTINYIISITMLILVLALFPIMLIFLLFSITRSLFDNWLNSLISYFIKPILLYAGMFFFLSMIGEEVYKTLGFRVCKKSILFGIIKYWYPDPYISEDFRTEPVNMLIPIAHYKRDENGKLLKNLANDSNYCEAFECKGERYPDLPLLDPNNVFDNFRIEKLQNENFLIWESLMWMMIYLLLCGAFLKIIDQIANFISSSFTPPSTQETTIPFMSRSNVKFGSATKQLSKILLVKTRNQVVKLTIKNIKNLKKLNIKNAKAQFNKTKTKLSNAKAQFNKTKTKLSKMLSVPNAIKNLSKKTKNKFNNNLQKESVKLTKSIKNNGIDQKINNELNNKIKIDKNAFEQPLNKNLIKDTTDKAFDNTSYQSQTKVDKDAFDQPLSKNLIKDNTEKAFDNKSYQSQTKVDKDTFDQPLSKNLIKDNTDEEFDNKSYQSQTKVDKDAFDQPLSKNLIKDNTDEEFDNTSYQNQTKVDKDAFDQPLSKNLIKDNTDEKFDNKSYRNKTKVNKNAFDQPSNKNLIKNNKDNKNN